MLSDTEIIRREFPEYPLDSLPSNIPDWLECTAWHNDACPTWGDASYAENGTGIALAIDYPDPIMRDVPEAKRFCVWLAPSGTPFESDDWQLALVHLQRLRLEALTAEYEAYAKTNELKLGSCDEMLLMRTDLNGKPFHAGQLAWLNEFLERWENAEEML